MDRIYDIPVGDIKKEVKPIIDTYRKERKKVISAEKSGIAFEDLYQPKLAWYNCADSFLQPFIKIRPTIETPIPTSSTQTTASTSTTTTDTQEDTDADKEGQHFRAPNNNPNNGEISAVSENDSRPLPLSRKRTKDQIPAKKYSKEDMMEKVTEIQECTNNALNQLLQKKDEIDNFGEMISAQMRRFKTDTKRMETQLDIQVMILQKLREEATETEVIFVNYDE